MVSQQLTEQMISDGRALTEALDEANLHATTAFWLYAEESHDWRYIFATRDVDMDGPRKVYSKVQKIFARPKKPFLSMDFSDVAAVSPHDSKVRFTGANLRLNPKISGLRISGEYLNGQYIEDAFVYRLPKTN